MKAKFSKSVLTVLLVIDLCCWCRGAGAEEILIPVTVGEGASLIKLTKAYCHPGTDYLRIAEINDLEPPFVIYSGSSLFFPLKLLITEKVTAQTASVIGGVFRVTGDGSLAQIKKGERILPGETLVTGEDGFAHLIFPDHKYIRISSNSEFTLTYMLRLADHSLKAEFFLKKGNISLEVKEKLKKNETFNTRTPISVTGVRGTTFRVKMGKEVSAVETLSGAVSLFASGKSVDVGAGKGSLVKEGQPPMKPVNLPPVPEPPVLKKVYKLLPLVLAAPVVTDGSAQLRITVDQAGNTTVWSGRTADGGTFSLSGLEDGRYCAFYSLISSRGLQGMESRPVCFEIRTSPSTPVLVSGYPGGIAFGDQLRMRWREVGAAVKYRLQLAADAEFSTLIKDIVVGGTETTVEGLAPGRFHIRVAACAEDGFQSNWSRPEVLTLNRPPFLTTRVPSGEDVLLQWSPIGEGTCELQIASEESFASPVVSQTGLDKSEYRVNRTLSPQKWFLRLRVVHADGTASVWSPPQVLTVEPPHFGWRDGAAVGGFAALLLLCL